jgi:hypothetical protein
MQYQLNTTQTDVLRDALDDVTGDEIWPEVIEYSGRGMYGRTCLGIIAKDADRLLALVEDALYRVIPLLDGDEQCDAEELLSALLYGRDFDSMGLSDVVYWPHIAL